MFSDLSLRNSQELMNTAPDSPLVIQLNAENFEKQGDLNKAIAEYRTLLERVPDKPGIHYRIGGLLMSQPGGAKAAEAHKEFEADLKIDARSAGSEYYLGELARQADQLPEAIRRFARATGLNPSFAEAYYGLGRSLLDSGKAADAAAPLETAEKLAPENPTVHFAIASATSAWDENRTPPGSSPAKEHLRETQPDHQDAAQERVGSGQSAAVASGRHARSGDGLEPVAQSDPVAFRSSRCGGGHAVVRRSGRSADPQTPALHRHRSEIEVRVRHQERPVAAQVLRAAMAGGMAIFDFDNDGKLDIFFTNGGKLPEMRKTGPSFYNCLLRNKVDGTFEDVTRKAGLAGENLDYNLGVAVGDYDNDGHEDLFICGGRNVLYHNNGDGTFSDVTKESGIGVKPANTLSVAAAWFDYDNDGLLDLVVSNYTLWSPVTDKRCSAAGVEYYCDPRLFYDPVPHRLYHNLGHGKFEDVTEKSRFGKAAGRGMGITIADFNDDGWQDVFIANDTEANHLFVNLGDGTFEERGLQLGMAYDDTAKAVSSMGSDARDYNNNGRVDIFTNNLMGQTWALFQNGGDFFRYVSPNVKLAELSPPYSGWSNAFIDYDNDGWQDLYSANGDVDNIKPNARRHDTMFENLGGKEFCDVSREMCKTSCIGSSTSSRGTRASRMPCTIRA